MDYPQMTAPCGLDCFNRQVFLAHEDQHAREEVEKLADASNMPMEIMLCKGCRNHNGQIPLQKRLFGEEHRCAAYECSQDKGVRCCCDYDDFSCDNLHLYADGADRAPHNFKVFNLCLIKKMGLEKWAESKASEVRLTHFHKPWSLG